MANRNKSKAKKNSKPTKSAAQTNAPTRRTGGKKPSQQIAVPEHLTELVCGVTDPFCPHAYSAKVFDMARVRTISAPYVYRNTYSSDANGALSLLTVPNFNNDFLMVGTIAANNALYTNGISRSGAPYVTQYRIVTMGMILTAPQAPLNRAGTVHLRLFNAANGAQFDICSITTYNCDVFRDVPLSELGKGLPIIFPRSDLISNSFVPNENWNSGANITAWTSPGWPLVQIAVSGATASTACLSVQLFVHFECVYPDNSTNQQLATFSPPAHPALVSATTYVQSQIEAFAHNSVESVARGVKSAARSALSEALRQSPRLALGA